MPSSERAMRQAFGASGRGDTDIVELALEFLEGRGPAVGESGAQPADEVGRAVSEAVDRLQAVARQSVDDAGVKA